MANTTSPYRRIGTNSWEELLEQVNDELQNPPSGCDPIDPIDIPDECHRWAKSDVREVHDKLNEMPGDCFTFENIPDLWKISIIKDIEEQLGEAWCDCGAPCCFNCPNCDDEETLFLDSRQFNPNDCSLGLFGQDQDDAIAACNVIRQGDFQDALTTYNKIFTYALGQLEWCNLLDELFELQAELEELEDELAVLEEELLECGNDPICITNKQTEIDDKQTEIDDKQTEIDDKQAEVNESEEIWTDAKSESEDIGITLTSLYANMIFPGFTSIVSLIEGLNKPLPEGLRDVCFDPSNASPEGPTTFCCGRSWAQCLFDFELQEKVFVSNPTTCLGNPETPIPGVWETLVTGSFDADGNISPLSDGFISGCGVALRTEYCIKNVCIDQQGCGAICAHPNNELNIEYRVVIKGPECIEPEILCDGTPCD